MGYLDAQGGDNVRTAFRRAEKQYKFYKHASTSQPRSLKQRTEVPATDLSKVIDFRKIAQGSDSSVHGVRRLEGHFESPVFVLDGHPGFYFIPEAVSADQQFHWIREALTTYPEPPNCTSHTAHYGPIFGLWSAVTNKRVLVEDTPVDISTELQSESVAGCVGNGQHSDVTMAQASNESGEDGEAPQPRVHRSGGGAELFIRKWRFLDATAEKKMCSQKAVPAGSLLRKLRWATLGIQFDWSKRAYDVSLPYRRFSTKLAELASRLAAPAMSGDCFRAEAAIVNYFGPDDMLGGHIDDMEADWSKPIVSMSLGCKAIFLLGGETREDVPVAMFLRSGDAVLMAGPARRCFHGVPRIFISSNDSDLPDFASMGIDRDDDPILDYIRESRININIRQVF